jgi:hypothetical protein
MKERFEQLAEEAKLLLSLDQQFGWRVIGGTDEHLEKFAELLIRECIQICEEGTSTQTTSNGAAIMIKQRFGVE